MTRPCGCGGAAADTCNCVIVPGPNTSVTGIGTGEDPYVITAGTTVVQAVDTASIDMTVSGDGSGGDPYQVSAVANINPSTDNLLTTTASGLLVPCTAVQDCVGEAMGPGLEWDTGDRLFKARLSDDPGNIVLFGSDGGLYVSDDGTVQPPRPRARVGKDTPQNIPTGGPSTIVAFDQVITDNAGIFTGVGEFTVPVDGGYTVGTSIQWQNSPPNNGFRAVFVRRNGVTFLGDQREAVSSGTTLQTVSTCIDLLAGDVIQVAVQHSDTETPLPILATAGWVPMFWLYLTTEGLG